MQELKLNVPTYYGSASVDRDDAPELPEFGRPNVPVLIHEAEGIRIVMGSHELHEVSKPDIQIERRPNGWAIFLHPLGGCDPCGLVYFLDDGRSCLIRERCYPVTPEILVLNHDDEPLDADDLKQVIGKLDELTSEQINDVIGPNQGTIEFGQHDQATADVIVC